jgi:hypothetical chaperone protein
MILGLDFGTTNTGAAVFDGQSLNLLPLDPAGQNSTICRTAMYFTRDGQYHFGQGAINRYFTQNLGRRTKLNRVWVGEIAQVFAELPTFYRDVYVYEDEFSPGRIFLSIKTTLRNPAYFGTAFQDQWYSASDLVATFLLGMNARIQAAFPTPVRQVVLGRPVHFSDNPAEDEIAQKRLLQAAFKAGFDQVYLEYEPVAAARFYEQSLRHKKETVLVFDFGGGTLDFSVLEIGAASGRRILATGGIPIAGDVFDQRLFRQSIPKHLGEGSPLVSGRDIPPYIFEALSDWQEVLGLNSPENLKVLDEIKQEAVEKDKVQALMDVITSNYALMLFDQVEKAKIRLSSLQETVLAAKTDTLTIEEPVTRERFERAIDQEYHAIKKRLHETIARSGLEPGDIDRVLRTGGSSQIPLFVRLLEETFGRDKVLGINTFSSVTSGLAIIGHEIETGAAHYTAYTPESVAEPALSEVVTHRGVKQRIDLDNVKRRVEVAQRVTAEPAELPYCVLLTLDADYGLSVTGADSLVFEVPQPEGKLLVSENVSNLRAALLTSTGDADQVLLATSDFRLMLTPARSILIAQRFGGKGIRDLLRLQPDEVVTAMTLWNPARSNRRFICLVTKFGQVRRLESRLLAGELRQAPYFWLEKKYYRAMLAYLGQANEEDELILGTNLGRIVQMPMGDMGNVTSAGIRPSQGEEVTAATFVEPGGECMAVSHTGQMLSLRAANATTGKKSRTWKGARIVGLVPSAEVTENKAFVLTARGLAHPLALPNVFSQGKTARATRESLALAQDDTVVSLCYLTESRL